jgi:hypothetical protein
VPDHIIELISGYFTLYIKTSAKSG